MPLPVEALEVFTDGSFDAGRRSGGWAFVALDGGKAVYEARGAADGQSNNTFEVLAVVEALAWIDAAMAGRAVIVWTDSFHVVEGCNRWRAIWRNNNWKRIDPNPRNRRRSIADEVLWRKLDRLLVSQPQVAVAWCKGHSGITGNEHADRLAAGEKF